MKIDAEERDFLCLSPLSNNITDFVDISRTSLCDLSPRDKKWEKKRAQADRVRNLYKGTLFDRYADRIKNCSGRLEFSFEIDESGTVLLKLTNAWFCRVPRCPVCQWRRTMMWRAKGIKVLPKVIEDYPSHRFIFLTLTVKNCSVYKLRETLSWMNKSWTKMIKRASFPAVGWLKAVEVTRGKDDTAHPHFHCLLMVKASYFSYGGYLSQAAWTKLWKESLQIDYQPIVNVKTVKPKKNAPYSAEVAAVLETFKYSVKPEDTLSNEGFVGDDRKWLFHLTEELYQMRMVATGGILRKYLKELENEPDDLIHSDVIGENLIDTPRAIFEWKERNKKYYLTDE